jgi:hypothetical protein
VINVYIILVLEERDPVEDHVVNGKIILKWVIEK